jgi:predicted permease
MLTSKLIKFLVKYIFIICSLRCIYWVIITIKNHSNCGYSCTDTYTHSLLPFALIICVIIILFLFAYFIVFVIKSNSGDYDKFYEKYTDPILKKIIKLLK